MNILIVDTDKINVETVNLCYEKATSMTKDDCLVIPKGIDIIQDISVDWMKMIRDRLDEKIKALESDKC